MLCPHRRKTEDEIATSNLSMFKRLQAVKPSGDVSRKKLVRGVGWGACDQVSDVRVRACPAYI